MLHTALALLKTVACRNTMRFGMFAAGSGFRVFRMFIRQCMPNFLFCISPTTVTNVVTAALCIRLQHAWCT